MKATRLILPLLLPLVTLLATASPLLAGPPWLAIELPPNPFDRASRGAFLLVHVFHYQNSADEAVTGRAIGIVGGERRTVTLSFERTSRPGVLALRNSWGGRGEW